MGLMLGLLSGAGQGIASAAGQDIQYNHQAMLQDELSALDINKTNVTNQAHIDQFNADQAQAGGVAGQAAQDYINTHPIPGQVNTTPQSPPMQVSGGSVNPVVPPDSMNPVTGTTPINPGQAINLPTNPIPTNPIPASNSSIGLVPSVLNQIPNSQVPTSHIPTSPNAPVQDQTQGYGATGMSKDAAAQLVGAKFAEIEALNKAGRFVDAQAISNQIKDIVANVGFYGSENMLTGEVIGGSGGSQHEKNLIAQQRLAEGQQNLDMNKIKIDDANTQRVQSEIGNQLGIGYLQDQLKEAAKNPMANVAPIQAQLNAANQTMGDTLNTLDHFKQVQAPITPQTALSMVQSANTGQNIVIANGMPYFKGSTGLIKLPPNLSARVMAGRQSQNSQQSNGQPANNNSQNFGVTGSW